MCRKLCVPRPDVEPPCSSLPGPQATLLRFCRKVCLLEKSASAESLAQMLALFLDCYYRLEETLSGLHIRSQTARTECRAMPCDIEPPIPVPDCHQTRGNALVAKR